ncbi:MAG: hypothetical protein WCI91_00130 [Candidatus Nomurabacteria bacterium]
MKMSKKRDHYSSKELTDFAYSENQNSPIDIKEDEREETTQEDFVAEE